MAIAVSDQVLADADRAIQDAQENAQAAERLAADARDRAETARRQDAPPARNGYRGQMRYGRPNGLGTMTRETSTYAGDWLDARPHGLGEELRRNSSTAENSVSSYAGEWRYGEPHGLGIFIWTNGDTHIGRFSRNEGGSGILRRPGGLTYAGEFLGHTPNGLGAELAPDGTVLRRGRWSSGRLIEGR